MAHTEQGQHYIELYEQHSAALAQTIVPDTKLWTEGFATLDLCLPALSALLYGSGEQFVITEEQVQAVVAFLEKVAASAGGELQQAILTELTGQPFASLSGASVAQAQGQLLGNAPPAAEAGGPYQVDEGGQVILTGRSSDAESDPLASAWDLDNDGVLETDGEEAAFSATVDGPRNRICELHGLR